MSGATSILISTSSSPSLLSSLISTKSFDGCPLKCSYSICSGRIKRLVPRFDRLYLGIRRNSFSRLRQSPRLPCILAYFITLSLNSAISRKKFLILFSSIRGALCNSRNLIRELPPTNAVTNHSLNLSTHFKYICGVVHECSSTRSSAA
ncbi:hypothetical protein DERF_011790 [Dermatophagoides farinae]|uniref:Uncharacterized protein n=1 Tax=Dermatophagoides farinae TaxID=6954 RepID=A0A922HVK2_DERFA|nr:hypothetical protein DERF_011790 [Dermatophagoides farinae]